MKQAFYRELQRIGNNLRLLFAVVAIPLFSLLFMLTIFGNGKIENLPTGVADCSNTPFSQQIIQTLDASPVLAVSPEHIYSNEAQAWEALQNMEIFGYAAIPSNFAESLQRGENPTVTYYYNNALLAIGGEMHGALAKALGEVSVSLVNRYGNYSGISQLQMEAIAFPTNGTFTSTYNSTLNYRTFLAYPFFFVFFQIFILVFIVYVIGTDMDKGWLRCSGNNMPAALAGKLLPYATIFLVQALLANCIFFCTGIIPHHGNLMAINISSLMLVAATISVGIAIISLIPKISIAISIASMFGALGATTSGITFPVENMYPIFEALCKLFPIRHFVEANRDILYNNAGFGYSWPNYAALLLTIPLCIASTPLLKRSIIAGKGKPLPVMWGVAMVMLGGTVGYGFLYGALYHPNIVTEVPVAVIDNSGSRMSRNYINSLDATQGIYIYAICRDVPEAAELMKSERVKGVIEIPYNFQQLATNGSQAIFTVCETTTSFLYYLTIQQAAASVMQELNNSLRAETVTSLPLQQALVMAQTPTFNTNGIALFNHNGGYGTYLLPIAIIIIIFQTMFMCTGILAGSRSIHPFRSLPLLCAAYLLLAFFLTGAIPIIFNLPSLANKLELYLFLLLVILTTAAFTGAVTLSLRDPEEVMLYVPFFSVGLIFLSGTSFPMVQIPHFWQLVHYFFPSSPAITGYIQLNSMGGSLHNIVPQITILAVQLLIYGTICILQSRKIVNLHKQP